MSGGDLLECHDLDGVRRLTLNRPEALNAFNDAIYGAVARRLREAAEDPAIACVLLTGRGRAFSAGQDLKELADGRSHDQRVRDGFGPFIAALESFPKPLIAAVNGLAVGIGLTLLPHCDLVLAARSARFRAPFASLGVTVEAGNSFLLPQVIGGQAAADLIYGGGWLEAEAAHRLGLVAELVADEDLEAVARERAAAYAAQPVAALVANKRLLLEARLDAVRAARAREDRAFAGLLQGAASRAALDGFGD